MKLGLNRLKKDKQKEYVKYNETNDISDIPEIEVIDESVHFITDEQNTVILQESGTDIFSIQEDNNNMLPVPEIISTGLIRNDSMVRVANIAEDFTRTIEPILRMYNAAVSVTTARIDIIRDEFRYRNERCPVHHIDTRVKSAKSILGKMRKKELDLTIGDACNRIYDIAGVRIVCSYIKDVYLIRDRIVAYDDIQIMKTKDYIKHPKENGYRSYHMVIRVPVFFMNKKQMVPVEIQIRTMAMDLWASLEHDIRYKAISNKGKYQGDGSEFAQELTECSRLIYEAEKKMEKMNQVLE